MVLPLCLCLAIQVQTFLVKDASPRYSVKIEVTPGALKSDDPDVVQGPGVVTVMLKGTGKILQRVRLPHLAVFKSQMVASVVVGGKQPSHYDDNYSFVFQDFDFDGHQDLAICNGTNSGYGLPSYDVFLFSPRVGRFVASRALSKLAQEHLGLFNVDAKGRRLVVYDKDGAAWHETSFYSMKTRRPVLVETVTQDDRGSEEVVTTSVRVGGKWRVKVKKGPIPKD